MLGERRQALHQDVGDQHDEEYGRHYQGRDAIGLETRFGAVATAHAGGACIARPADAGRRCRLTRRQYQSYCSRYLLTMCRAMRLSISVRKNSTKPERKSRQRLGAVELLIADEDGLDLHRDGGDGIAAD